MTEHASPAHAPSAHGSGGLQPRERSAALPASTTPAPPQPLISPTGNVALDALGHLVNRAAEPWQDLPNQTPVQKVATVVNGVLGILNMDVLVDAFNLGVGALSSLLPSVPLPAAVLGMPHIGTPHTHLHPPSLVPPAPPIPLPSIGTVSIGGCVSVLIGGMPAARAGDLGLALTCGTFAPPFEIATGSSSVFIGGSRAARMGDITKHCGAATPSEFSAAGAAISVGVGLLNAAAAPNGMAMAMAAAQTAADAIKMAMAALMGTDPGAPPCIGAVMMGMPNVMIGGFPVPPIENYARAFFQKLLKPLANVLHSAISKTIKNDRLANFFHEAVCHTTGHPVDVASGRVLTSGFDLRLSGAIPLEVRRQYASSWCHRDGVLGRGWSHTYDQAVWPERGKMVYRAEDGREIEFDLDQEPGRERPAWLQSNERWDRFNRLTLRSLGAQRWEIESTDGLVREFGPVSGEPQGDARRPPTALSRDMGRARLSSIRDRSGNTMTFRYDANGHLDTIVDSAGRQILLETNSAGRLARILVPHPESDGWMEQARYAYSPEGDLVEVYDALGNPFKMAYEDHLLVRETNRNGLCFYFEYEGGGPGARCVKTCGDGDIYVRKLAYDPVNHVTVCTDSYGADTIYQMNGDNAVIAVTDALGGVTSYTFDDSYRKIAEKDPLGAETRWEYDARGNCTKVIGPDGATVELTFNERNQAVRAIDPVKGEWRWGYDSTGHLAGRIDPLGRRVQFHWSAEGSNGDGRAHHSATAGYRKRLIGVTDPAGHDLLLRYDSQGNLAALRTPDGAEHRWQYDRLGRCVAAVDPKSNAQWREFDAMGRVTRVREADSNVRELEYDAEDNVVRARDQQHDVRFEYQGMGRLRARTEAGTTVCFDYDKEERLVAITNEHGHVYQFELGPTGLVRVESGFDGVRRKYERDLAGRVTKLMRPGGKSTEYTFDAMGRVRGAKHSDGSSEKYGYREDGELVLAENDTARLTLERDVVGRVIREVGAENSVTSEYDTLGMRVRLRSSKGLDQHIERNSVGQAVAVRATNDGLDPRIAGAWEVKIMRDALGLEIERTLPGGVKSKWERDAIGRAVKQEVWSAGQFRKAVQYQWDVDDRLQMVIDAIRGPTWYDHDAFGNLAAATHADGRVELRMPDAVGNLFRTRDRSDRKYGPAGQLLEARGENGISTRYEYDSEGNLIKKIENLSDDGERVWRYEWGASGMLVKVVRPDGEEVAFTYDPLGRRLSKTFRERVTRWIWDGNVPLHEWVETIRKPSTQHEDEPVPESALERAARYWGVELTIHPPLGPPPKGGAEGGTAQEPITWLFDPESFAPMAKLVGKKRYGIVTDHLGTPTALYDVAGQTVWSGSLDTYGELRDVVGTRQACPFRWQGQYEDEETGLYYNRFRYYDPSSGEFVSSDPLELEGGLAPYGYVHDPLTWMDPLGLARCGPADTIVLGEGMGRVKKAVHDLQAKGIKARWYQALSKNFPKGRPMTPAELHAALGRNERWLRSKIAKGFKIYDIGPDGRPVPSPFYAREQSVVASTGTPVTPLPGY
jgi:RHS repeat-associated protein